MGDFGLCLTLFPKILKISMYYFYNEKKNLIFAFKVLGHVEQKQEQMCKFN